MIGGFDLFYPVKEGYKVVMNNYRNKLCNGRSRPLFNGELHPLCANYEGPGTRIDLESVRNTEPYNGVDRCARAHDFYYKDSENIIEKKDREKFIRWADEEFKKCVEDYRNEQPYYVLSKGIGAKNIIEDSSIGEYLIPSDYYGKKY